MVDIQTISIVIASASVVAGVVYYAFQIRSRSIDRLNRKQLAEFVKDS